MNNITRLLCFLLIVCVVLLHTSVTIPKEIKHSYLSDEKHTSEINKSTPHIIESASNNTQQNNTCDDNNDDNADMSIPPPKGELWKKGVSAFADYDYKRAVLYFEEATSPLCKYYLAKIYFGDVFINNLEGTTLPEINREKAIEILDKIAQYKEVRRLKKEYMTLVNSPEELSKFYYERGNYTEAVKVLEGIEGKEVDALKQKYMRYAKAIRYFTPASPKPPVSREEPELTLNKEKEGEKIVKDKVEAEEEEYYSLSVKHRCVDKPQPLIENLAFSDRVSFVNIVHPDVPSCKESEGRKELNFDIQPKLYHYEHEIIMDNVPLVEPISKNVYITTKPAVLWNWPALPGYHYRPVGKIDKGTKLTILDDSYKWYYKVELPDGRVGYVCSFLVYKPKLSQARIDKSKIALIEQECSEYVDYLVDMDEAKHKANIKKHTKAKKKKVKKYKKKHVKKKKKYKKEKRYYYSSVEFVD